LGLRLAFVNASATAVWPPTGIALAAFLMLGYRVWPAILLGAFLVNVTTSGVVATSFAIAMGNTLEGILGCYLIVRFAHGRHVFERARDIFTYFMLACILSTTVSATIGVTSLVLSGLAAWADYGPIWLTWWLGDAVGAIVVTPVLVLWAMNPRIHWNRRRGVEALLLCLAALLVALIVFGGLFRFGIQHYPLESLLLPIIVWAAFRFGQRGAATLALGLSAIAIWGTLAGFGPFARGSAHEALLLLQAFMGVIALTGLGMAAVVAERQHVREAAEQAAERTLRLQQVTASLSEALSAEDVAAVIVGAGSAAFQADAGAVFRLNDDAELFELLDYTGYPVEVAPQYSRSSSIQPGPLHDAVLSRELVIVESAAELLARWPHLRTAQVQSGDMATVAVPLLSDQRVLGVFYLAFRSARRFSHDDRAFLTTLGRQCALALVRADLYEHERRARGEAEAAKQRASFLAEASRRLADSLDYPATLRTVSELVVPTLADWCGVYLLDDHQEIQLLAVAHQDPAKVDLAYELHHRYPPALSAPSGAGAVLRTGQVELVAEIADAMVVAVARDAEHLELLRSIGFASLLIVPLTARGRTLAALALVSSQSERRYGPDDVAVAQELAQRAGYAIDNSQLYQQAQQAVRLREQFLSIAAHELKTPLTTLLGQAQFFQRRAERDGQLSARDQQSLRVINDQVKRLHRMVLALLDVSRIDMGQLSIERNALDICALTRRVVEELQLTITDRRIDVQGSTVPIIVAGDEVRLEQVLQNLLQNALKYSDPPHPIAVTIARQADQVRIAVQDQGMGIPADALSNLFQRFYRAANAEAQHISGMGIGLYVVKEIMALHGGGVSVESTEGAGSTFTVWLPVVVQAEEHDHQLVADQVEEYQASVIGNVATARTEHAGAGTLYAAEHEV
jgi:signal transduction histidine kinase/integral membrane sensor domain MASE1